MLGAGLDARGPAPLALAEIGARQQFAERQDAGERGADVVRERRSAASVVRSAGPRRGGRRRAGFAVDFFFDFDRANFDRTMAAPRRCASNGTAAEQTKQAQTGLSKIMR